LVLKDFRDDIEQGERSELIFRVSNTVEIRSQFRTFYVNLNSYTTHNIKLNFKNSSGSTTISDAIIEIMRVF